MKKNQLDAAARDAFLVDRRLGILTLHDESEMPIALPLWYRWDGREVEMISERKAPKVRRLERDPRASLLATNNLLEPACWVSLEGRVAIDPAGAQETAARLVERYLVDPKEAAGMLKFLRRADMVRLSFVPERIRTYAPIY